MQGLHHNAEDWSAMSSSMWILHCHHPSLNTILSKPSLCLLCEGAVKVSHSNLKAQMKEAAICISAVNNILRNHSSLTLDAGQMLEEVRYLFH